MRLKKLHIIGSVLVAGIAITTLSSNSSGITGKSTVGCGGATCHGAQSTATVVSVTGLPTNWVANTTYPLTLTVSNAAASKAGFDLTVNIGTITSSASNVMPMGTELHHTAPQNMASGTATWTFNWKAPATTANRTLTMNVAGNAVNGDNAANAGDVWNTATITSTAAATSIGSIAESGFAVYPNPATDLLTVTAKAGQDVQVAAFAINGAHVAVPTQKVAADKYQVNIAALTPGAYMLVLTADGKTAATRFVKQ